MEKMIKILFFVVSETCRKYIPNVPYFVLLDAISLIQILYFSITNRLSLQWAKT